MTYDESDNSFKIRGDLRVTNINDPNVSILVNEPVTLTWTTNGTVPNVYLEYSMDNFATVKPITTIANPGSYGSYVWMVPDDISFGLVTKVRVSDTRDAAACNDTSDNGFRIRGWFRVIAPSDVNTELNVNVPYIITWETSGTMSNVTLEWSKLGDFSDTKVIATSPPNSSPVSFTNISNGTTTYSWNVPDEIINGFTAKVRVRMTGDDQVNAISEYGFKIRSNITPTIVVKLPNTPPNKPREKNWVVTNETNNINWAYTGSVPQVTLLYSRDNFVADVQTIITNTANTGSYDWKIADARSKTVKVRVYDARDVNLITGAGAYGETAEFMIDYYHITFNLLDDVTRAPLNTFKAAWNYLGTGDQEFGPKYYTSPVTYDYPYGQWTTAFTKINYSIGAIADWWADMDKEFTMYMESSVIHQWYIMAQFNYNPDNDTLHVASWFERDGLIMQKPESVEINIYDQTGEHKKTLSSSSPDAADVFHIDWADTHLQANVTYLAKITLTYSGKTYTSAQAYNISIPVKLKQIGTTATNVEQITSQTSAAAGRIETSVNQIQSNTTLLLPQKMDELKQALTALVESQITGMANNINKEITPYVRSGLINRPTDVKAGDMIPIRFKGPGSGLTPLVTIYDDKTNVRIADVAMPEAGTSAEYLYSYKTLVSDRGEFTIMVHEPKSGVTDAMIVRVNQSKTDDVYNMTVAGLKPTTEEKREQLGAKLDTMQSSLVGISNDLAKIEGIERAGGSAQEDSLNKIVNGLSGLTTNLKQVEQTQAYNFGSLLDLSNTHKGGLLDLRSKADDIKSAILINQDLLKGISTKFRVDVRYYWGSVIIEILAESHMKNQLQRVPVRTDLPKEVKQEDIEEIMVLDNEASAKQGKDVWVLVSPVLKTEEIIKQGGLAIGYDNLKNLYYVYYPDPEGIELKSGEFRKFRVRIKDIWNIDDSNLEEKRTEAYTLLKELDTRPADIRERGKYIVLSGIEPMIELVKAQQKKSLDMTPQEHIFIYRDNLEKIKAIDLHLESLRRLVVPPAGTLTGTVGIGGTGEGGKEKEGAEKGGLMAGITPGSAWKFILIIVSFLGILSIIFFLIWQAQLKKARVSPELKFTESELTPPPGVEETKKP